MQAFSRIVSSVRMSPEQQAYKRRARFLFLAASALLIICLTSAWLILRSNDSKPVSPHVSVLNIEIEGREFLSNATADELLALADRQSQKILDTYPNLASAFNVKANRSYLTGNLELAKTNWSRALELDPQSTDAILGLASIALEAGEYQRTIELCEQCMFTKPGNPRIPLLLAESYLQDGQAENSILVLCQHIASEPTSVQALELLGTAYLNNREYEKSITQFKHALGFSPNSKDSFYGLAQASSKLGRPEEAKKYMARFSEIAANASSANQKDAQTFKDRAFASHVAAQVYVDSGMIYRQFGAYESQEECLLRAQ